jgi:short-subunit dehydrogenase
LRSELVKQGIYITTVCPGMMRTGSHVNAKFKGRYRSEQTWFSVLNSNPLLSANAVRAAEKILRASEYGRASLILTLSAKLMAVGARLAPELVSDVLATADTMLPESPLPTTTAKSGRRSRTLLSPSILTALSDRAVARNNE